MFCIGRGQLNALVLVFFFPLSHGELVMDGVVVLGVVVVVVRAGCALAIPMLVCYRHASSCPRFESLPSLVYKNLFNEARPAFAFDRHSAATCMHAAASGTEVHARF